MWRVADQGWGGDAYPGEQPETQAVNEQSAPRRDYTERTHPDPATEHHWVFINGHIVMDTDRDAKQLVEDHGYNDTSKPLAYGRVAVQHRWSATFQVDHTNVSPYLVIKALKGYAKEQGWGDIQIVDHHNQELLPPVTADWKRVSLDLPGELVHGLRAVREQFWSTDYGDLWWDEDTGTVFYNIGDGDGFAEEAKQAFLQVPGVKHVEIDYEVGDPPTQNTHWQRIAEEVGDGWNTAVPDWKNKRDNPNSDIQDGEWGENPKDGNDSPPTGIYDCPDCAMSFDNYLEFERHMADEKGAVVPGADESIPNPDHTMPAGWNNSTSPDWVRIMSAVDHPEPVPAEPGTTPIPPDHMRLYHYTGTYPQFEQIKQQGIRNSEGVGENYGEPSQIWASTRQPPDHKAYFEFSVPADDPRLDIGKLQSGIKTSEGVPHTPETWARDLTARGSDVTLPYGDIEPHEIIAAHEPWHSHYRYLQNTKDQYPEDYENALTSNWDGFPDVKDAVDRINMERSRSARLAAAPKVTLPGPIPFIFDIQEDRIYVGHPGEEVTDVQHDYSPLGVVEGEYLPTGQIEIRTQTNMPYTIRHMIQLWYYLHPELEVKGVQIEYNDGSVQKLAAFPDRHSSTQRLWRGLNLGLHTMEEVQAFNQDPLGTIQNAMSGYGTVAGIHWTDDPVSAENFALARDPEGWAHENDEWEEGQVEVGIVLETEVDSQYVVQPGTEEYDGYQMTNAILDYGTEREVTVRDGAPITIHSAWLTWDGDQGGVSKEIQLEMQHTAAAPDDVGEKIRDLLKQDPSAVEVYNALSPLGNVYVVGGAIRDLALGLVPKDIDIMAQGISPEDVIKALKTRPGHVEVTGNQFPVIRYFHPSGEQCEVALPRREESTGGGGRKDFNVNMDIHMPVEEDLERRDFTGNSMAVDLKTGQLIDPYGGWEDLENGDLKMVHPKAFEDDATRILRALSSKSRHGLHPDADTQAAMSQWSHRIDTHVPNEQKAAELEKLMKGNDPASAIQLAQDTGVLKHILPELAETDGFDQKSKYHNKLLFDHINEVLRRTAEVNKDPDVRMAAALHDIGKPGSQWFDDAGYGHYYEKHFKPDPVTGERQPSVGKDHEHHGADLARDRLKELTWGNGDRQKRVEHLIRSHMFDPFTDHKGARKFLHKYDPNDEGHANDLMDLRWADSGQKANPWDGDTAAQRDLIKQVREQGAATNLKGLALNGSDVMGILGIKGGPEVGQHLQRLQEIVLEEPALNTREDLTQALMMKQANILDPVQDRLDPDVFENSDKAKPKVKAHIVEWIRMKVNGVLRSDWADVIPHTKLVMTGSLTSYQWSHKSDFDVSVWFDYEKFPNLVRAEMISLMVTELDGTVVPGTTHDIQCYIVPNDVHTDELYKPGLRSAYDLDKNKWIVAPERERIYNPYTEVPALMGTVHDWAEKLKLLKQYDPPGAEEYLRQIHERRRRDQKAGKGDFSESNVLWKYLEHMDLV